jgi:hypothetical protein
MRSRTVIRRRVVVFLLLLVAACGTVTYSYQYYVVNGRYARWPKAPDSRKAKPVMNTSYIGSIWEPSLLGALATWNGAGAKLKWFYSQRTVIPSYGDRKNSAYWGYIDGTSSTLAVTTFYTNDRAKIKEADIRFDSGDLWTLNGNVGAYIYDFQTVALHESGHAIGLAHETGVTAIMNPYYAGANRTLYPDDYYGIINLYP